MILRESSLQDGEIRLHGQYTIIHTSANRRCSDERLATSSADLTSQKERNDFISRVQVARWIVDSLVIQLEVVNKLYAVVTWKQEIDVVTSLRVVIVSNRRREGSKRLRNSKIMHSTTTFARQYNIVERR